ncbi:hypothetical protein TNCV_1158371 [Trichonephila clavipes]|nr:hypothetical protein TNCV_1158371 [Trichonephila clavipes]
MTLEGERELKFSILNVFYRIKDWKSGLANPSDKPISFSDDKAYVVDPKFPPEGTTFTGALKIVHQEESF